MPAIARSTDLWVVRDPPSCCQMTLKDVLTKTTILNFCDENFDRSKGHPCAWLSKAEARRDAAARLRLWLALRRRWNHNGRQTLP